MVVEIIGVNLKYDWYTTVFMTINGKLGLLEKSRLQQEISPSQAISHASDISIMGKSVLITKKMNSFTEMM